MKTNLIAAQSLTITIAAVLALIVGLTLSTPAHAITFTAAQAGGTGDGSGTNYGQSFTPNIAGDGIPLTIGNPDEAPLTSFTLFAGPTDGSGAHFLNIYDSLIAPGDSGAGIFVGSSTNTVNFTGQVADNPMIWNFDNLLLDYDGGTKYFAAFSTTNVAGAVTNGGQSLRNRNTGAGAPDDYSGGHLLHVSSELATNDARFTADFDFTPVVPEPSTFALLGLGMLGLMRRRCRRCRTA